MRILQVNLNRCRAAHDLLEDTVGRLEVDLCLLSEPNIAIAADKRASGWISDDAGNTAIWWTGRDRRTCTSGQGIGAGYSWLSIENGPTFYSCYFSPNRTNEEFECYLDELDVSLRDRGVSRAIVTGDFNAKAVEWGSSSTSRRGEILLEWIARRDMLVLNDGVVPTFCRRNQQSYIDLTLCSSGMQGSLSNWQVLEGEESLSDHRYILFDHHIAQGETAAGRVWSGKRLDLSILEKEIAKGCANLGNCIGEMELTRLLGTACKRASPAMHPKMRNRKANHWWCEEIADVRKRCNAARRRYTRSGRDTNLNRRLTLWEAYKAERYLLKRKIRECKERAWRRLCEEVEEDVWGQGYQIVMGKLARPRPRLAKAMVETVVTKLFPKHPDLVPEVFEERLPFPPVTMEEIQEARRRIASGKAPGPDGIPPIAVKIFMRNHPDAFRRLVEGLLQEGRFPGIWKQAKLVLLPKPGKPDSDPSAYRPICLLNVAAKALEMVLSMRLNDEIESRGLLSDHQYGFRKGRSTFMAVQQIRILAEEERQKTRSARKLFFVVLLDIKNAFNSLSWRVILDALHKKGISPYLRRMVAAYLSERMVYEGDKGFKMTAGVPQGSVLGPVLWNLAYDEVLQLRTLPEDVQTIAYADDLALMITAKHEQALEEKSNQALETISKWMREHNLALAPEKTEAILLIGRKKCDSESMDIRLDDHRIEIKKEVKYLGVILDRGLTGSAHVSYVAARADKVVTSLARLMPRTWGASEGKRRLLATVAESIILYAAPAWEGVALQTKKNCQRLLRCQRKLAIRVCRAYRTAATAAVMVLARIVPWPLAAKERTRRLTSGDLDEKDAREVTLAKWQEDWKLSDQGGRWTKTVLPDIRPWYYRKHGETNYYLTQVLTGHGCFQTYLARIGKVSSDICVRCNSGEKDDVEHTILRCQRFCRQREELMGALGNLDSVQVLINKMIDSEDAWHKGDAFIKEVMQAKELDERRKGGA